MTDARSLLRTATLCAGASFAAGCGANSTPAYAPGPAASATATPTTAPSASATPAATASPAQSPTPVATASPTASPRPAASPASTIALAPAETDFTATGYALAFGAAETTYTGNFTATSTDCSGIVTFAPSSAAGPNATFSIASVAAGTCHITIGDAYGQTASELVHVTTTTGTVNARPRR